jgi:hypothetical protein
MSAQTRLNTPTHASTADHNDDDFSIARLWVLRLLVTLKGHRTFITPYGFDEKELARWLGLLDNLTEEQEDEAPKPTPTRRTLTRMLAQAERRAHQIQVPTTLASNVARIAALVGLSDVECRVLEFVLLMRGNQHLNQACEHVKNLDTPSLAHALGVILGQSPDAIRQALRGDGLLAKTGLVSVDMRSTRSLDVKFDLLSNKLPYRLIESEMQPTDWLKDMIVPSGPGHLDFEDYAHCAKALQVLRPYLRQALDQGQSGVNVLLYGPPGTG